MRDEALSSYRFEMVVWALLAPHAGRKAPRQPSFPRILKGSNRGDA